MSRGALNTQSSMLSGSDGPKSETPPSLSVVVIGRNEGQRLVNCLASIRRAQDIEGNIEVIYVDSGSVDGSTVAAAQMAARVISLDAARPTAAMGRNAGWRAAGAEFVLFLDGDTLLDSGFPRKACNAIRADPSLAAVWGHRRETHPESSIYNRVLDLDWVYAPGIVPFCGGDALMRREAIDTVGGYDQTLIAGEEPELCRRLRAAGYGILHIDEPMTGHDLQMTRFRQYWRRATRAGHAYAEISSRFRNTPEPFWQAERKSNILRGGFWIVSLAAAAVASLVGRGVLPLFGWCLLLLALSLRTAWKAQWKAPGQWRLLMMYGIHSHLQQVPILIGQLQFDWDRMRGKTRALIEYKQSQ